MKSQWILVLALGLMLAVMAPCAAVRAQDVNRCIDGCFNGVGDQPGSTVLRDICVNQCSQSSRPTVFYGAVAYGAHRTVNGYAFGKGWAAEADRAALSFCRQHGTDCQVVVTVSNSCAAVAAIEPKGVFAVGQAATREQARSKAMSACTSRHGGGCEIEAWPCARS